MASVKKVSAEIAEAKAARTTCDREAHAGRVLKDAFTGILENDIGGPATFDGGQKEMVHIEE